MTTRNRLIDPQGCYISKLVRIYRSKKSPSMKSQIDESITTCFEYAASQNFEISDEKAFSAYFAFFYFEKMKRGNRNPVFQFERQVFKEANFPSFITEKQRLDILLHLEGKKVGFEFKYPKETDQQPVKKRAEIYQAIGRLVHLADIGFLDKGFLICATNNAAIYSATGPKEYPTHEGYSIDENSYILPSKPHNDVISHSSYGKIWNCSTHNLIRFEWRITQYGSYHCLNPIEISKVP